MKNLSALILFLGICLSEGWGLGLRPFSLVENKQSENRALLVGVADNLLGIDEDLSKVEKMLGQPAYQFKVTTFFNSESTIKNVTDLIRANARKVDSDGTFFFYFSGHGEKGEIWLQDGKLKAADLRRAIEEARENRGALARLILVIDACHSGSIVDDFDPKSGAWKKMILLLSSDPDESSFNTKDGSIFTQEMKSAFDESVKKDWTIDQFIARTKEGNEAWGRHAVSRLFPLKLGTEKLVR